MSNVIVKNNSYTVDPLYQWDLNQELEIRGLSLSTIPEIHFTNSAMDGAIVKNSTMDKFGVVKVDIPNSILQKPYTITAYICIYEGPTFKSLYKIEIPVKARKKPLDYSFEDNNGDIYSYNAINNKVENFLAVWNEKYSQLDSDFKNATKSYTDTVNKINEYENRINTVEKNISDNVFLKSDILSKDTKISYGLGEDATPDNVFNFIKNNFDTNRLSNACIGHGTYEGTGEGVAYVDLSLDFGDITPEMIFLCDVSSFGGLYIIPFTSLTDGDSTYKQIVSLTSNYSLYVRRNGNILIRQQKENNNNAGYGFDIAGYTYHYYYLYKEA